MSFINKILSSFKNIHVQSLMGNGVSSIAGLLIIALLFRALSMDDAGMYFYLMIFYNFVDTVKAGFLTNAFITFYAGTRVERKNEIAGSAWTVALLMSAAMIVINIPTYFLANYVPNPGLQLYLRYFSIFAISTVPWFMANLVVQGEKRFDRLFFVKIINQLLFIAAVVILMVQKNATLATVMIAFTVTNFMASFILIPMGWTMVTSIKFTTKKMLAELFHFGKYSMGTSLSTNLFRMTDSIFITNYLGAPALAVYNLGARWMALVEIPMLSFASSGIPILAEKYNTDQNDQMMHVMKKLIGMLTVAVFVGAILAIVFANPLVLLLGGNKYLGSQAPNLFRIFMTTALLFPTDRFFAMTVDVIKKPYVNFYKLIIMVIINLVGDYVSVTYFKSDYAVAITNFFPLIAAIIITSATLQKYHKFNFWNMYAIGYDEVNIFVKNTYRSLINKSATAGN